jgi:Putative Flp pilus-assembly TadE/G-like
MLPAGRWRSESQHGQALVLVALCLPLLFAILALVVDGATLMAKKRAIQNAADAAALAGAQELPASGPCLIVVCQPHVRATIEEYSAKNGGPTTLLGPNSPPGGRCRVGHPEDTNCYTNPYLNNDQLLEVRLQIPVTTFFTGAAHIIGPFSVAARAVASAGAVTSTSTTTIAGTTINGTTTNGTTIQGTTNPGTTIFSTSTSSSTTTTPTPVALFSKDTVCGSGGVTNTNGLRLDGNRLRVSGLAVSNGNVTINGNPQTHLDAVEYGGPNNCTIGGDQGAAAVGRATVHTDDRNWPKTWDENTICTPGPGVTVYNDTGIHTVPNNANGIYCALNGTLELGGDGTVTLIAKTIKLDTVQTVHISAKFDNLLFYQTQGDMTFIPNNSDVTGWIWVPRGRLTYGGNSANQGFYEAFDVTIVGNSFNLTGNGPTGGFTISTTSSTTTSATTIFGTTTGPTTIPGITNPGSTTPSSTATNTSTIGTTIRLDE